MPITTVNTNDVLTASHFNTNYRDQVVSTTTSGARPAGTEGQFIYETDTNRLYVYTGAAWELVYQQGGWTSYTPQVDQGATNIAKTVTYAKYATFGKTIMVNGILAMTGAGTAANAVSVTVPVTASTAQLQVIGSAEFYDSSASTRYVGAAELFTTSVFIIETDVTGNGAIGTVGFTGAIASGDSIRFCLVYEAA